MRASVEILFYFRGGQFSTAFGRCNRHFGKTLLFPADLYWCMKVVAIVSEMGLSELPVNRRAAFVFAFEKTGSATKNPRWIRSGS
jgi:hypothetical protein